MTRKSYPPREDKAKRENKGQRKGRTLWHKRHDVDGQSKQFSGNREAKSESAMSHCVTRSRYLRWLAV